MEFTGIIKNFSHNAVTIETDENMTAECSDLIDRKLTVSISRYRAKRSLDANAYFHVLSNKISEVLTISKAKSKNVLICKYGQPQLLPDDSVMVYKTNAPQEFMWEQETIHCIPVKFDDKATFYKVYRGSHTYDTNEMSLLIDGTVADAKELKIETLTPEELRKMKERWGV
jgi:hypothetical protein